jgi:outer membrane receptor protein involved in Fe transport
MLVSSDEIKAIRARETQQVNAKYRNVYAWATLDYDWSDAASSRWIASYTDLSNDRHGHIDDPTRTASVSDERTFHVFGLRWENTLETAHLRHRFGIEARRLWGQYRYESDVSVVADTPFAGSPALHVQRSLAPEPDGYETLGYWDLRAELTPRWTVQGGIRIDTQTYDGSGDGEQWSPRLSMAYALAPRTTLRASWGRFYQPQGINKLQVEDGIDRFQRPQFADHLIVGFDHSFALGWDLRVEAYRKRYRRLHPRFENLFDPLVLFPEAEYDRVLIAPESARAYGVETLLRLRPHRSWSGWLSYTWSQVEDRIDGRDVPRSWDQRHAFTLGIVWSKGPWTAALTDSYHSGWPRTELVIDASSGVPRVSAAARNRERFKAYNSLDLKITRVFALPRGALDVFVEVTNLTDRNNPCCVQYVPRYDAEGNLTYERDVDDWLPLVPSAGVLWRF